MTRARRYLLLALIFAVITTGDYLLNPTRWYDVALFCLPLTILFTLLTLRNLPDEPQTQPETLDWQPLTWRQIAMAGVGLLLLFLVSQAQGRVPTVIAFVFGMHHGVQLALVVGGMGLILGGMAGGIRVYIGWEKVSEWMRSADARWLLLFVIIGAVARGYALGTAVHFYTDETNFATTITRLRIQPDIQIMNNIGPIANFTWLFSYFQYFFVSLFGTNLSSLRIFSALVGIVTIPAMYMAGRWAFNRRIGLLSAFLMAVFMPHIHFSRLAMNNIADPLLGIVAIALLWRAIQTRSRQTYALAGACLGLTQYFYEGGRLLLPALVGIWIVIYIVTHSKQVHKKGIAIFFATFALIASAYYMSLGVWGFTNVAPRLLQQRVGEEFWAEFFTSQNTGHQLQIYIEKRINPAYLHIVSEPDGSGFYYSGRLPLVMPYLLPFMLIGYGVALYRWRGPGLIFPLWVILTVLGNSLIGTNNWSARFVVVFPALVLLIVLGFDAVARGLMTGLKGISPAWKKGWIIAGLLFALFHVVYYFTVDLPYYNTQIRTVHDDQDAGFRTRFLPETIEAYIITEEFEYLLDVNQILEYEQYPQRINITAPSIFDWKAFRPDRNTPYAFFIEPDDQQTYLQLQDLFNDGLIGPFWSPYDVPRYKQYALYLSDNALSGSLN